MCVTVLMSCVKTAVCTSKYYLVVFGTSGTQLLRVTVAPAIIVRLGYVLK